MTRSTEVHGGTSPTTGVAISDPKLWRLQFERKATRRSDSAAKESSTINANLRLQVVRLGRHEIGAELTADVDGHPGASVSASYRASFALAGEVDSLSLDEVQARLTEIAQGLAPSLLFPYLREAIGSAASRARVGPITLPVVNFRSLFASPEVEVPPFEDAIGEADGTRAQAEATPRPTMKRAKRKP